MIEHLGIVVIQGLTGLEFQLDKPDRTFGQGILKRQFHVNTGPIQISPGTPSLGALNVDGSFVGNLDFEVVSKKLVGTLIGSFHWNNADFKTPKLKFTAKPDSLESIWDQVVRSIHDDAASIFGSFLQDANKWLKAASRTS